MCFSQRKSNGKISKQTFQEVLAKRQTYTQNQKTSQFLSKMLQFMQANIKNNLNSRHLHRSVHSFNTDVSLQRTFIDLSQKQQMYYYQNIVDALVENKQVDHEALANSQMTFEFRIAEPSLFSQKQQILKVEGSRFLFIADHQQFDLRNYWLRQSRSSRKSDIFYLLAHGNTKPYKFKFIIIEKDDEIGKIVKKLQFIIEQAIIDESKLWKAPVRTIQQKISIIQDYRSSKTINSKFGEFKNSSKLTKKQVAQQNSERDKIIIQSNNNLITQEMQLSSIKGGKDHHFKSRQFLKQNNPNNKNQSQIKIQQLLNMSKDTYGKAVQRDKKEKEQKFKHQMQELQRQQESEKQLSLSQFGNVQLTSFSETRDMATLSFYSMEKS